MLLGPGSGTGAACGITWGIFVGRGTLAPGHSGRTDHGLLLYAEHVWHSGARRRELRCLRVRGGLVELDRRELRALFQSDPALQQRFGPFDAADRKYWHEQTPDERLAALELMRQSVYGYENPTTRRLQRVLEIVKEK